MKPKTLVLMVVAVVCGLGASYMTSRLLAERGDTKKEEKVLVLVAKKQLDMGTTLQKPEALFHRKAFLKGQEPKNAITNYDDLKGKTLKNTLREDYWVTKADILGEEVGLSWRLPQGMRAVGIRVNMEASAAGFANLPMSRVDILHTVKRSTDDTSFSQVLLENVLVLAADTDSRRDERNQAMPASVVTVALTPEDALKVAMAKEIGNLSLVLRKVNDNERSNTAKMSARQVIRNESSGKSGLPADGIFDPIDGAAPPVASLPGIPDVNVGAAEAVAAEPLHRKHLVRIIEGDRQRHQAYLLDKEDRVVDPQEVRPVEPQAAPAPAPEDPPLFFDDFDTN